MIATLASCSKDGSSCLNPITFTDQHGNAVMDRMRYQRACGRFCDVSLMVKERQFGAHRNILAACSPYFDSILVHNKVVKEKVVVNCQNPTVFELLLNYMYSGSVVIDRSSVAELLKLANNFLIVRLKNYCAEYLDRCTDAANCLSVKKLAAKYNMPALLKNATEFFELNLNKCLLESVDILEYDFSELKTIIEDPKHAGNIQADTHLRLIARWVNSKTAQRESHFKELLQGCDLSLVPGQTLENLLDYLPLFTDSQLCRFILLREMQTLRRGMQKYEAQYLNLCAKYDVDGSFGDFTTSSDPDISMDSLTHEGRRNQSLPPEMLDDMSDGIQDEIDGHSSDPGEDMEEGRPTLKLKIQLGGNPANQAPNRKNRLLGKNGNDLHKLYRKTVSVASKRRGRPPKVRSDANEEAVPSGNDSEGELEPESAFYELGDDQTQPVEFEEEEEFDPETVADDSDNEQVEVPPERSVQPEVEIQSQYSCPHCVFKTNVASRLIRHAARHSRNILYVCNICQFENKWNKKFYEHMRAHFEGPPFQCDTCEFKALRIQALLSHRLTHSDDRPYKCPECNLRCRTKNNLVIHHRVHTGEKPFKCPHCEKMFAMKSNLDQHVASHSDDRPFTCDICNFTTKYQSHLISHRRVHTGDLFHCHYHGCNYSSPKKSQLAAHLRTHLAVRSHQCKICNRSFIEKSHLVRHERIHLEDKPFKCDNCDYASSRRDKLKEHIQKHHNSATSQKQHRRRYRRAKQLAQLTEQHAKAPAKQPIDLATIGFRPINESEFAETNTSTPVRTSFAGGPISRQEANNFPSLAVPSTSGLTRPSSAIQTSNVTHPNVSPSRSLNVNLNVHLGTNMIETPSDSLVTPIPRSPQSFTQGVGSEYFITDAQALEAQRPMSLPPYSNNQSNQQQQFHSQQQIQPPQSVNNQGANGNWFGSF
uniref:BTB domain-containing protein n=1 Tax=Steinernema glaseri TaxID=37863 RepID=A0A1I7Y3S5_9BILA